MISQRLTSRHQISKAMNSRSLSCHYLSLAPILTRLLNTFVRPQAKGKLWLLNHSDKFSQLPPGASSNKMSHGSQNWSNRASSRTKMTRSQSIISSCSATSTVQVIGSTRVALCMVCSRMVDLISRPIWVPTTKILCPLWANWSNCVRTSLPPWCKKWTVRKVVRKSSAKLRILMQSLNQL